MERSPWPSGASSALSDPYGSWEGSNVAGPTREREPCSPETEIPERARRPSRSCHGEGNRQQPGPEWLLDLSGVAGGGTFPEKSVEQERPYLAAKSGKDRGYKAGRLKSHGARRESEGSVVPEKACRTTRWREGALL